MKPLQPHPGPQQAFLASTADRVLYGGARGGGKSFCLAWKAALQPRVWHFEYDGNEIDEDTYRQLRSEGIGVDIAIDKISIDYPNYRGLLIRREFPQLERNLKPETEKIYPKYGGEWKQRDRKYVFPSGAQIWMVHCKDERALRNYIGGNYHFVGADESNQFPWEWIQQIASSVRSETSTIKPQLCLTANPGGVGHHDLKELFVDRCPPVNRTERQYSDEYELWYQPLTSGKPIADEDGVTWQYIPATVFDNPSLVDNDPQYVRNLKSLPPTLKAMWLDGDWDVFRGQYFDRWDPTVHIIDPGKFEYGEGNHFSKETHDLYRAYDYGTKNPFVCLFAAVDSDGKIVIFDEISEVGLSASEQAKLVNEYTLEKYGLTGDDFTSEPADYQMWVKSSEKDGALYSAADSYADEGIFLKQAIKDRKQGAKVMYDALITPEDGVPRLRFHARCEKSIQTIPNMSSDPNDPEDVDKNSKDHWYDTTRYLAMEVDEHFTGGKPKQQGWREAMKEQALQERHNHGGNFWRVY